jgi:hypothetical protein
MDHPFTPHEGTPRYVTCEQLMTDVKRLAANLSDIDTVIGVARSGLSVATMLAMLLHKPLLIYRPKQEDLVEAGNGWRLTGHSQPGPKAVVIDDTSNSGASLKHAVPRIKKMGYPDAVSAVIYLNPLARYKPTMWVSELPHPHLLEWNLPNSVFSQQSALDFDGILCQECSALQDDDGPRYMDFLVNVRPMYYTRRCEIPMVVTGRLEKYRDVTLEWLARNRMVVQELVMHPAKNNRERAEMGVVPHKVEHFRKFMERDHLFQPPMFIESCPRQAQQIARQSGGLVVCPAAGRCFKGPN